MLALVWAALAVVGLGAWEEHHQLHASWGGALVVMGLAVLAIVRRHPLLAVIAVVAGTLGIATTWDLHGAMVVVALGTQFVILHLLFKQRLPTVVVAVGALLIGIGLSGDTGDWGLPAGLSTWFAGSWWPAVFAVLMGLPGMICDRTRIAALAPVALPGLVKLAPLAWQQPAWLAVGAAFALLGVGALISRRSVRNVPPEPEVEFAPEGPEA